MFLPEPHKNIKFLTKGRGREAKNNNNKNKRSRKKKASRTIHIYSVNLARTSLTCSLTLVVVYALQQKKGGERKTE